LFQQQPAVFPNAANNHGSFFSSSSNGNSNGGGSSGSNVANTKTSSATTPKDVEGAVNLLGLAYSRAYSSSQQKNPVRYNDDENNSHSNSTTNCFEV